MNKEHIYDSQIFPLMGQIIDICKQHRIAFVASFSIPNDDDPSLVCTSAILEDDCIPPASFLKALRCLRRNIAQSAMITVRDAEGNVKEMHSIIG